jgi:hypothetical protein
VLSYRCNTNVSKEAAASIFRVKVYFPTFGESVAFENCGFRLFIK